MFLVVLVSEVYQVVGGRSCHGYAAHIEDWTFTLELWVELLADGCLYDDPVSILQCLGTNLGEFFRDESEEEQIVFTEEDYFEKEDKEHGNRITWIIPNAQKNSMEPICVDLKKNGSTYPDNPHEGEEFGYVLKGEVEIHIGRRIYEAKEGESFYYTADKPHYLTSREGACILWVASPPSF